MHDRVTDFWHRCWNGCSQILLSIIYVWKQTKWWRMTYSAAHSIHGRESYSPFCEYTSKFQKITFTTLKFPFIFLSTICHRVTQSQYFSQFVFYRSYAIPHSRMDPTKFLPCARILMQIRHRFEILKNSKSVRQQTWLCHSPKPIWTISFVHSILKGSVYLPIKLFYWPSILDWIAIFWIWPKLRFWDFIGFWPATTDHRDL